LNFESAGHFRLTYSGVVFDQLAEGVFRRRYDSVDLNVGVVIGEDGVLVVDTRASHRQAGELIEELDAITSLPVRWVVNTHWHWDHVFGNSMFPDAEIWGHELCEIAMVSRGEEMKTAAKEWLPPHHHEEIDRVDIVPPVRTFAERTSIAIGRAVDLSYHGFGHTDADIIISMPDADVSFFGDLVEEGASPSFGDSYPVAWPLTLRLASESLPGTIVPGHGDVVDPDFVRSQHEQLVTVAELATEYVNGEIDLDTAASSGPYSDEVMRSALLRAQAVAS
jgi:glyoxylase-like metal-dependent hydrolase (beta-lactamase superfamily II)